MHFVASPALCCLFVAVYVCSCRRVHVCVDDFTSICVCACARAAFPGPRPVQHFLPDAVSHCYSTLWMQYPAIQKPNYQSSQLFLANLKAPRLAAHFLSISNTQVDRNTEECKLQNDACVCVCLSGVWVFRHKNWQESVEKCLHSELKVRT